MPVFYDPDFSKANPLLNQSESNHAIRVLRLKPGNPLQVIDGRGSLYHCEVKQVEQKLCELQINKVQTAAPPPAKITIALAPPKNTDRLEWFLEKATEIGADEIIPFTAEHSERRKLRPERLEKIIVAATKQSQRLFLPNLQPLTNFKEILNHPAENKYIAHCYPSGNKKELFGAAKSGSTLILIGPEGDFSQEEVELAVEHNFMEVSLGQNRLRTETAAILACHTLVLARPNSE